MKRLFHRYVHDAAPPREMKRLFRVKDTAMTRRAGAFSRLGVVSGARLGVG
jgi:hypothetical protein